MKTCFLLPTPAAHIANRNPQRRTEEEKSFCLIHNRPRYGRFLAGLNARRTGMCFFFLAFDQLSQIPFGCFATGMAIQHFSSQCLKTITKTSPGERSHGENNRLWQHSNTEGEMSASINQFGLHTVEYAIRKKRFDDPLYIAAHPESFPQPGTLTRTRYSAEFFLVLSSTRLCAQYTVWQLHKFVAVDTTSAWYCLCRSNDGRSVGTTDGRLAEYVQATWKWMVSRSETTAHTRAECSLRAVRRLCSSEDTVEMGRYPDWTTADLQRKETWPISRGTQHDDQVSECLVLIRNVHFNRF